MVSLVLWDISFQERQGRVSPWSSHEGRYQRRRRWWKETSSVLSCWASSEAKSVGRGNLWWGEGGALFCSTNVVIGNLNRETGRG
jgi:hypothetical protein